MGVLNDKSSYYLVHNLFMGLPASKTTYNGNLYLCDMCICKKKMYLLDICCHANATLFNMPIHEHHFPLIVLKDVSAPDRYINAGASYPVSMQSMPSGAPIGFNSSIIAWQKKTSGVL